MSDLKDLKVLILESNNLTNLTVNSLKQNMPNTEYTVVAKEKHTESVLGTSLQNCERFTPTLVVKSGVVLNLKEKDLPSKNKINAYDICLSREGVFTDHKRLKKHYKYVNNKINKSVVTLDIFIINPSRWETIPQTDKGILKDLKKIFMPRYMHHKHDVLFKEEATAAIDAFNYGVLGEQASVFNYIECIERDTINMLEIYGYCFDKLLPYIEGVPKKEKERIEFLEEQTTIKIKNTRQKISNVFVKY